MDDVYFDDWMYLLSDTPTDEYDSDYAFHAQVMAEEEDTARIARAALLSSEHTHFMAWLAEKEKEELYEEFEEFIRAEHTNGEYPASP